MLAQLTAFLNSALYLLSLLYPLSQTYHHARSDSNPPPAVGVGHDVPVPNTQEGDGYQPHGVQQVGVLLVVIPATIAAQIFFQNLRIHTNNKFVTKCLEKSVMNLIFRFLFVLL